MNDEHSCLDACLLLISSLQILSLQRLSRGKTNEKREKDKTTVEGRQQTVQGQARSKPSKLKLDRRPTKKSVEPGVVPCLDTICRQHPRMHLSLRGSDPHSSHTRTGDVSTLSVHHTPCHRPNPTPHTTPRSHPRVCLFLLQLLRAHVDSPPPSTLRACPSYVAQTH